MARITPSWIVTMALGALAGLACESETDVGSCGDGDCAANESPCTCPGDCPLGDGAPGAVCCVAGDCSQPQGICQEATCDAFVCSDPVSVDGCCGNGACEDGETEADCAADCTGCLDAGGWHEWDDGPDRCCDDAAPLKVNMGVTSAGQCAPADCGVFAVCAECGDGVCGVGETFCSCPDDCDGTCVGAGGVMIGLEGCCAGLTASSLDPSASGCTLGVCTDCGDGTCDFGETESGCPADCGPCVVAGETFAAGQGRCCDGLDAATTAGPDQLGQCPTEPVVGATLCTDCGDGTCDAWENHCNCATDCDPCMAEGGHWAEPATGRCCPGLVDLRSDMAVDDKGVCEAVKCGVWHVCTDCGDGACGIGESLCTCAEDCAGTCVEEGGAIIGATGCCEGLDALSLQSGGCALHACTDCGNGTCDYGESGESCPTDCLGCTPPGGTFASGQGECCPGASVISTAGPDGDGQCPTMPPLGAALCSECGDDTCDSWENHCNCAQDCPPPCVKEGGWWGMDGTGQCCPGLEQVGVSEAADGGQCLPLDCGVWTVCADCGDGMCGTGESFCTCEVDCPGDCVQEGGVILGTTGCCSGLKSVPLGDDGACLLHACVDCGDGTCSYGEDPDNCPPDCYACTPAGSTFPSGLGECCEGLDALSTNTPDDQGVCPELPMIGPVLGPDCGDGSCAGWENHCNCLEDCPAPQ